MNFSDLKRKTERLLRKAKRSLVAIQAQPKNQTTKYAQYLNDPVGFCREILSVDLVPKQQQVAKALLEPPFKVLVPSGHEQGKTFLAGCIAVWWFATRSPAIVYTTAPTKEALKDLLWKEIHAQAGKLGWKTLQLRIERSKSDFMSGRTARDTASFQGHHGPNMLFIFEEAEGIASQFFTATEGMFSPPGHAWLVIFNPLKQGTQVFNELKGASRGRENRQDGAGWNVIRMSAADHPNIKAELEGKPPVVPHAMRLGKFEKLLKQWSQLVAGEPLKTDIQWPPAWATEYCERTKQKPRWYRPGPIAEGRLLALYSRGGTRSVWSEGDWFAATREGMPPLPLGMEIPEIGCDVARGGEDYTAIHGRAGACSIYHERYNGQDTHFTRHRLMDLAEKLAFDYNQRLSELPHKGQLQPIGRYDIPIKIDDSTFGGGITDELKANGYMVYPINNATLAATPDWYPLMRDELWFTVAELAREDKLDLSRLPQDVLDELQRQATVVEWDFASRARRQVQSKDVTKAKLGFSPDDMDAVNLAYFTCTSGESVPFTISERVRPTDNGSIFQSEVLKKQGQFRRPGAI